MRTMQPVTAGPFAAYMAMPCTHVTWYAPGAVRDGLLGPLCSVCGQRADEQLKLYAEQAVPQDRTHETTHAPGPRRAAVDHRTD